MVRGMKIKGWRRINAVSWRNRKTNIIIQINTARVRGFVLVLRDRFVLKEFRTKTPARKFAIKYMRSHPNG